MKFYPYEKGGGGVGKSFSHTEGGGGRARKVLGCFLRSSLGFLAILKGGTKSFDNN